MTAYVGGVDVSDGNIETSAGTSDFLGGSDDRFRATEKFAHGIASGDVPQGPVLALTGCAGARAFPAAVDDSRPSTQRDVAGAPHVKAEVLEGSPGASDG